MPTAMLLLEWNQKHFFSYFRTSNLTSSNLKKQNKHAILGRDLGVAREKNWSLYCSLSTDLRVDNCWLPVSWEHLKIKGAKGDDVSICIPPFKPVKGFTIGWNNFWRSIHIFCDLVGMRKCLLAIPLFWVSNLMEGCIFQEIFCLMNTLVELNQTTFFAIFPRRQIQKLFHPVVGQMGK